MSDYKAFYKYLSVFSEFDMLLSVSTHVNCLCENRWLFNTALSRCYSCLFSTFTFCLFTYFFSLGGGNTASFSKLRKCMLVASYPAWNCSTGMYFRCQVSRREDVATVLAVVTSSSQISTQSMLWKGGLAFILLIRMLLLVFSFLNEAMSAKTLDLFLTTKLQLIIGILILWVLLITLEMRNQCLQWIVW